ncbi:inositol 1,4,5-triphosphate receptor associated 1-like isoform X3 [Amphibalanus amphitrite]|uniref:inositol 1,4,5-triphosphate receptor associated 1-like isoform X3 n=1 Tax=Amphibalanus amphitrite TaxID=1232801 RepID=UPI001C920BC2|nr:inositol 1,4,5-triphosphate receptor associated 1-like isoform X3 [Amphibalanus amphitrite]
MASSARRKVGMAGLHSTVFSAGQSDKPAAAGGGPVRLRFKSMPTMVEDEDAEVSQAHQLRPSLSVPVDPADEVADPAQVITGDPVSVFPSLTKQLMADFKAKPDVNANNTAEKDLENKFSSLALAFKTDRLTLQERLDVQRRHRDQAEHNLELETQRFRDQLMQQLSQADEDRPAHLKSLQRQVEIFKQISQRLSSTAEVLGAVQQELRVSHAVEVMTQHVENLRHLYDREHAELEEARRVLASHKLALQEPGATKAGPPGRRRASIAVFAAGRGSPSNGEARPPTVAPPSGSPTNQLMLKRRRNSADGKSFDSITEEKEEEREHDDTGTKPETASDELYRPDEDELRSHVESAVSDELASLRSEQEQLANDLRTLLSRQTGAVVEQTSIAGRVVWDLVRAWPYSREETAHHLRFCCGGLFLVLAVLVLLVPPAFGLRGHQRDV